MDRRRPDSDLAPLGAPMLHVLLALGREHLHGYGIMQAIEDKTSGVARILPGTLYTTLNRMLAEELIEEVAAPADAPDDDRRRRYYRMTQKGRAALEAETERMTLLLAVARKAANAS